MVNPADTDRRKTFGGRRIWLAVAALLLLAAVVAGGLYAYRILDLSRPDHWKPGDTAYELDCGGRCKELGPIGPPDGPDKTKPTAVLGYNPKVNDRIAQWGDCLQSVMSCAYKMQGAPEAVLPPCVERSICPAACKDAFKARSAGLRGQAMMDAYLAVFSEKEAYCTPRGA